MIFRRGRRGTLLVIALITVCGMMLALPAGGGVRSSALLPAHGISGPTPSAGALPAIIIRPPPQPNWVNVTNVSNGSSPPPSFGGSSAYDPVENGTVYFGGCREIPCFILTNETWVFANGIWTNLTNPLQAPPARDYATMDYDANMQGVLLFGGDGYQSPLGDTWLFQGGVWTNVSGWGQGPPARYGASMAFDPQPEENGSVLFGGYSSIIGYLNDTWVWHGGAGWVPLTTPSISPPQVVYATMAYDASDGYMVLFGGYEAYSAFTSTTWELYSGQWWEVSPHSAPTARDYSEMLYVPSLSGVLLFGGYDALGNERNDTWIFANGAWTEQSPSNAPPARDSFGFALDGTGTTALIIGGDNFTQAFQDTWAYEFTPQVSILPNVSTAEVGENVTFSASVAHGTAPYEIAVGFGDGAQAEITAPGPSISFQHAFAFVGSFEFSATVTDAVGAVAPSNTFPFPISGPRPSRRPPPPPRARSVSGSPSRAPSSNRGPDRSATSGSSATALRIRPPTPRTPTRWPAPTSLRFASPTPTVPRRRARSRSMWRQRRPSRSRSPRALPSWGRSRTSMRMRPAVRGRSALPGGSAMGAGAHSPPPSTPSRNPARSRSRCGRTIPSAGRPTRR